MAMAERLCEQGRVVIEREAAERTEELKRSV